MSGLRTVLSASVVTLAALAPANAAAAPPPPMAGGADCTPPKKLGVAFVIDDSGSNTGSDPNELRRDAALAGVASLPDGSTLSVSTFSSDAQTRVPTSDLTAANRGAKLQQVRDLPLSSLGGTDYEAAFNEALARLDEMEGADKRIVIFLTDGEPTSSFSADRQIAAQGVPIFSLGYGSSEFATLQGISSRSGGRVYPLGSSGDARAAFSDILDTLSCRSVFDPTTPELPAGEVYKRGFPIGPLTSYFRATVAWEPGEQPSQVEFVRPDGSRFPISGPAGPTESLVQGSASIQLTVDKPQVGRWKVRVKGDPNQPISLEVDAATASEVDPGSCPPGVSGTNRVQIGAAIALGCFQDQGGGVFTTAYPARIGGFEADPDNDNLAPGEPFNQLVLDTANEKIETVGKVALGLGGALLPGSPTSLPVRKQSFEFSIADVIRCRKGKPDCVLGTSPVDELAGADVDLWGFKVPGTVEVTWTTEGSGGSVLRFEPSVDNLLGPLAGKLLEGKNAVLEGVGGGITAKLDVVASNDGGFELGASELAISPFKVSDRSSSGGEVTTRFEWPVTLTATGDRKAFGDEEGYLWTFAAAVELPKSAGLKITKRDQSGSNLGVAGTAFVFDGRFAGAGAEASGLNIPLGASPVFFQRAALDVLLEPGFGIDANVGLTGGPQILGVALVEGDPIAIRAGTLAECRTDASPDSLPFQVAGTLSLPPAEVAGGVAEANADLCYIAGDNAIEGSAGVKVLFLDGSAGVEGTVVGWVDDSRFNLDGDATIRIPGLPDPSGHAVLSSVGVAGCGEIDWLPDGGVGYRWGEDVTVFSGCDLAPWTQPRDQSLAPGAAVARAAPNTFRVRKGLKAVGFRVNASGGAPQVRITGPDGTVYDSPAGGQGTVTEDLITTKVDQLGQAFVFIRKPKAGSYTVSQLGGPAITSIETTRPLAPPKVRGKVKPGGRGKRVLRYRVRPLPGQRVVFFERGNGSVKKIGAAKKRRGKLRYEPGRGTGKRRVVAEVRQGGLPRTDRRLDRYRVRGPRPPKQVRRLRLTGSPKRGYTLRWSKSRRAKRYYVKVRYRGRTLERGVRKRKLRLGDVKVKKVRAKVQPARGSRVGRTTKKRNFRR